MFPQRLQKFGFQNLQCLRSFGFPIDQPFYVPKIVQTHMQELKHIGENLEQSWSQKQTIKYTIPSTPYYILGDPTSASLSEMVISPPP